LPVLIGLAVTRPGVTDLFTGDWADAGRGLGGGESAAEIYSLMLATFLGTMGLPHVLVRFYTNVDGPAARRTTVTVLGLLGVFYLFPGLGGLLAHRYVGVPAPGESDSSLLRLPAAALTGSAAVALGALVAAGGVLSTDLLPGRVKDFRLAAVVAGLVPIGLALATTTLDISQVVGM